MPTLFLEVFVLGVCVSVFAALVVKNQTGFSATKRVFFGILIAALAYTVALKLQRASTSQVSPPPASTATTKDSPSVPAGKPTEPTTQPAPGKQAAGAPDLASLGANEALGEAAPIPAPKKPCRTWCAEVIYDGPTAAGGVINPREIMAKELIDAGFDVLVGGVPALVISPGESTPASQPAPLGPRSQPDTVAPRSPSGLTVKEIFEFIRKAQQGEWRREPAPTDGFLLFSTPVYAASPPPRLPVLVAMHASMQHLNENQGIFSTEANMQIAAVTSDGKKIQSVVMMAGPEMARGFGLDWNRAEEAALKDLSAKMCPQFAKGLQRKLRGEK